MDLEAEDLSVLILTEPEYVGSGNNLFKRKLAKLVTSKTKDPVHTVVVAVRSARTPTQGSCYTGFFLHFHKISIKLKETGFFLKTQFHANKTLIFITNLMGI